MDIKKKKIFLYNQLISFKSFNSFYVFKMALLDFDYYLDIQLFHDEKFYFKKINLKKYINSKDIVAVGFNPRNF